MYTQVYGPISSSLGWSSVAITAVMLIALGFEPIEAASVALVATPRRWPSAPSH